MVQYTRCFGTIKWRVRGFFEGKIQSPSSTDYSTLQTCIALETKFTSIAPGSYIYDTSNSFNYLHQFEKSTNKVLKKRKYIGFKCSEPVVHHLSQTETSQSKCYKQIVWQLFSALSFENALTCSGPSWGMITSEHY